VILPKLHIVWDQEGLFLQNKFELNTNKSVNFEKDLITFSAVRRRREKQFGHTVRNICEYDRVLTLCPTLYVIIRALYRH